MDWGVTALPAFIVLAAVVIATPGQDTALTIRNTLSGGRAAGVLTALGVAGGQAVWLMGTSAGLAALLLASETLFLAVRLAGAAYLVYLGVRALRDAIWPRGNAPSLREVRPGLRPPTAFRQGLFSNLGNPKMAVFFTTLLPPFVPGGALTGFLLLGAIFSTMTIGWLSGMAFVVDRAGGFLRRSAVRRAFDAALGTVFVALGFRVATSPR